MLTNYFRTALRNLLRHKLYGAINIAGLATGLVVCMIIMVYVEHEHSYDSFHRDANRIVWLQGKMRMGNDSFLMPYMSYATAPLAKQGDPSVEGYVRFLHDFKKPIIQNPQSPSLKLADEAFLFADSNFFQFFSFPLLSGNSSSVLQQPFTVVVSRAASQRLFGEQNPVGKTIRYNNAYTFTVTGVAEDAPSNSSIRYDFVASASSLSLLDNYKQALTSQTVQLGSFSTYFLLRHPSDAPHLQQTLVRLNRSGNKESTEGYLTTPITDTHLNANYGDSSNTKYLSLFPFIAGLILLLAVTNYVSLSTARATVRAKEIGVRKAMGASRRSIGVQFFVESALYTAVSFLLATLFCFFLQPYFFHFLQIDIDTAFLYTPSLLLSFAALFLFTSLSAAFYPSLLLSAYQPVKVLYGKFSKQSGGLSVRRFFTVFQFSISVVLIICGLVIGQQIDYVQHADTGVAKSHVVMIPFAPSIGAHYGAFKKDASSIAGVIQTATAHYPMYKGYDAFFTKAYQSNTDVSLPVFSVDQNFIPMLQLQWKTAPTDASYIQKEGIIINEMAVAKLNLGRQPLHKSISLGADKYEVAGVLKDFNYESLQNKINALCLFISSDTASGWGEQGGCLFVKLQPQANVHASLQQLQTVYETYDKQKPFEYSFLDETYNNLYAAEERLSHLLVVFISLATGLACLGLFGLATFMAVQRTKEIGIRKVLGASVAQVTVLLSGDFIKLVGAAILIAMPIAGWFASRWLQDFAYRISLSWEVFCIAGSGTVLIALLTVSVQAIKAAVASPVKSLRTE